LEYSAPTIDGDAGSGQAAAATTDTGQPTLMYEGTPRNAKCPCGSGKTYKRCHGDPRNVA
jgi:preprotein translocase subunit SecA